MYLTKRTGNKNNLSGLWLTPPKPTAINTGMSFLSISAYLFCCFSLHHVKFPSLLSFDLYLTSTANTSLVARHLKRRSGSVEDSGNLFLFLSKVSVSLTNTYLESGNKLL